MKNVTTPRHTVKTAIIMCKVGRQTEIQTTKKLLKIPSQDGTNKQTARPDLQKLYGKVKRFVALQASYSSLTDPWNAQR